jgi:hypothetical protein
MDLVMDFDPVAVEHGHQQFLVVPKQPCRTLL